MAYWGALFRRLGVSAPQNMPEEAKSHDKPMIPNPDNRGSPPYPLPLLYVSRHVGPEPHKLSPSAPALLPYADIHKLLPRHATWRDDCARDTPISIGNKNVIILYYIILYYSSSFHSHR